MSHYHPPPRRVQTQAASRKRKEAEPCFRIPAPPPPPSANKIMAPPSKPTDKPIESPRPSNRLLAGYMAHEFLTKGTLLGQQFDPARAEAVPLTPSRFSRKPEKEKIAEPNKKDIKGNKKSSQSYAELANLLKSDGAHIPGIINPTQLSRWIQM